MIVVIGIVLLGESFTALGQLCLKKSTNSLGILVLKDMTSYLKFTRNVLALPRIWLGLCLMAVGLLIWLVALSWFDLSLVFPLGSIQYVLVLFASRIFLNEKIDSMKLWGTFLVVAGITAIAFS